MKTITNFADNHLSSNSLPHVNADSALHNGLLIFFGIIGAIAFLMMVVAGLNMILSEGNPDKVAKARNTIIYAGVGLAVAASAAFAVSVVLSKS